MNQVTLDEALETAMQLDADQREMLVDILRRRQIEAERQQIAADARASLAAFRAGELPAQDAPDVIRDLRQSLESGG
jgi:hypothetical protein